MAPGFFCIREMEVALRLFPNIPSMGIMEDIHNVSFEYLPTSVEETHRKIIKTWSLAKLKAFTTSKTLAFSKGLSNQMASPPLSPWTQRRVRPT